MKDIVCVGGVTYDIFFKSKFQKSGSKLLLPWGGKTVVEAMDTALGGGGANAAVGFARLGLKTALLSRVGVGHISQSVCEGLQKSKVDTSWLIKDPESHTATSILLLDTTSGERTIVMYRGRNDFFNLEGIDIGKFLDTRWLYVADLASSNDNNNFIADLTRAAQDRNIKIAFTPAKRQLKLGLDRLKPIFARCDVVIMNQSEWDVLTNNMPNNQAHSVGPKIVVITQDVNGVTICAKSECFKHPAPQVKKVIDTTGAGDAFSAGFVGAMVRGEGAKKAADWGTKNAGSVISQVSAQAGLLVISQL